MAEIISREGNEITITLKVKLFGSMIEMEQEIQNGVNSVGCTLTKEALESFDTNGSPLQIASLKLTSKGKEKKEYETPYGRVEVSRHVYQSSKGGKTFCPLDTSARIIIHSTPKFAKIISYKYSSLSAKDVAEDLSENHSRKCSRHYIQDTADYIGSVAIASEEQWEYEIPKIDEAINTISLSLDGTCILMREDGYREAMTGNVSLYNAEGDRVHTIYVGAAPEYGKQLFQERLQREIDRIKQKYPEANYVAIADGATSNWKFLEPNASHHILDFYHATEYLAGASYSFQQTEAKRKQWLYEACHILKHEDLAAQKLLLSMQEQMTKNENNKKISKATKEKIQTAITYFTNQQDKMDYKTYREKHFPIGSGVTEAACKTLIKQRLCKSAMQWKISGAKIVIAIRSLVQTTGRWNQFWNKINQTGINGLVMA